MPAVRSEADEHPLLNHVIGTLWLAEAPLSDQAPRHPMAPGGLLHGWDLAKATGLAANLDGRLTAHMLEFAQQALATPESRAGRIGPPGTTAAPAPGAETGGGGREATFRSG